MAAKIYGIPICLQRSEKHKDRKSQKFPQKRWEQKMCAFRPYIYIPWAVYLCLNLEIQRKVLSKMVWVQSVGTSMEISMLDQINGFVNEVRMLAQEG